MTLRQAFKKKFGAGILGSLGLYARIWHIFNLYACEYEKSLTTEQRALFRKIFGS